MAIVFGVKSCFCVTAFFLGFAVAVPAQESAVTDDESARSEYTSVWEGSSEDDIFPRKLEELGEQYLDGDLAKAREALEEMIEIFETDPFFEPDPWPHLSGAYARLYCLEYAAGRDAEAYLACQHVRFYRMKVLQGCQQYSIEERAALTRKLYAMPCEELAPWQADRERNDGRGPAYEKLADRTCGQSGGTEDAPEQTPVAWTELPAHPEASEFGETTLFDGDAHEIYYTVDRPYPFDGVYDFYVRHFGGDWISCTWSAKDWHSFIDGTTTPTTSVHRKARFWVHPGKSRLIALFLNYRSKDEWPQETPDNTSQQVAVIEYLFEDVAAEVERLQLECESDISRPPVC